ncbi:hypothetical protein RYX36_005047 [Vicia faba]
MTGAKIGGKTQWRVTIVNKCNCPLSQIILNCQGFQSTMPVDSTILLKRGDNCLLYNGHALSGNDADQFAYAWDTPFNLYPKKEQEKIILPQIFKALLTRDGNARIWAIYVKVLVRDGPEIELFCYSIDTPQ